MPATGSTSFIKRFYTSMGVSEDFTNDTFNKLLVNAVEWTTGRTLFARTAPKKQ